jgi:hypothetical protein
VSQLEASLSEIDRKLREIQDELAPHDGTAEPTPEPPPPEPSRAGRDGPLAEVLERASHERPRARRAEEVNALQTSLLSSMTEVLAGFQRALAQMPSPASRTEVTVSAGPFQSIEAVRAFERQLAALPGVKEVTVRGYEGEDRALIDVQLTPPNT